MNEHALQWRSYTSPRYWGTWTGFAILWLCSRMPYIWQLNAGKGLGIVVWYLLPGRRRITLTNLALAFPDKNDKQISRLAKKVYRQIGMSIAEGATLWFRPVNFYAHRFDLTGTENLESALAKGNGVILLQAHFSLLEMVSGILGPRYPISAVFDPPKNPLFSAFLANRRSRFIKDLIENRDIRQMVRNLKRGEIVWYSPDQSVARHHGGIPTRFFGQPVLTTAGTGRIVRMTNATVLPLLPTRLSEEGNYRLHIGSPIAIDSNHEKATQAINDLFEDQIKAQPEQYFWMHKRFKPPGPEFSDPYKT